MEDKEFNVQNLDRLTDEERKKVSNLLNIKRRKRGDEEYAKANLEIGKIIANKGYMPLAKRIWEEIQVSDSLYLYSKALYNIGLSWEKMGDEKKAIYFWKKVERRCNLESFICSRVNLGIVFSRNKDYEKAIQYWSEIKEEDGSDVFHEMKLFIGVAYHQLGMDKKSISFLDSIALEDNKKYYAEARNRLGVIYYHKGNIKKAIEFFSSVRKEYDENSFGYAMFHLGLTILEKNMDEEGALEYWHQVVSLSDNIFCSEAKFGIGRIYLEQGKENLALDMLRSINIEENTEAYTKAQLYLAEFYSSNGEEGKAVKIWEKITEEQDYEYYLTAKVKIGIQFLKNSCSEDYYEHWDFFGKKYYFGKNSFKKSCSNEINLLFEKIDNKEIMKNLTSCFMIILGIIDELKIYSKYLDFKNKSPERKFAHYTSTSVANLLLQHNYKEDNCKIGSRFRLNTINNVNDPSEGLVLYKYLSLFNNLYDTPDSGKKNQVFLACFTFNHDSLNQFRLYGKENHKEASGISLIFKNSYFQTDYYSEVANIDIYDKYKVLLSNNEDYKENLELSKQELVRCIYLEPNSGYIRLAQRDKLTFYHEFEDREEAEKKWNDYQEYMVLKTKNIQFLIDKLKFFCEEINKGRKTVKNLNLDKELDALLEKMFLPIKYLIKHSAFQEEQECRMMYITTIDNPKVQMVYGEALYIEYAIDIKDNLDKVYIAPAATQYQPYLAKLLCDTDVKIELSNNPYRQTS